MITLESEINVPLGLLVFRVFFKSYGLILDSIVLIYIVEVVFKHKVSMELPLFYLTNFLGAVFIQGPTFIPEYRVRGSLILI